MTSVRAPRYRLVVYELQGGKTTQVLDTYGSGFTTAVATLDGDIMEVHFSQGGPHQLQQHIAEALADEYPAPGTR